MVRFLMAEHDRIAGTGELEALPAVGSEIWTRPDRKFVVRGVIEEGDQITLQVERIDRPHRGKGRPHMVEKVTGHNPHAAILREEMEAMDELPADRKTEVAARLLRYVITELHDLRETALEHGQTGHAQTIKTILNMLREIADPGATLDGLKDMVKRVLTLEIAKDWEDTLPEPDVVPRHVARQNEEKGYGKIDRRRVRRGV